ncbi:MAG: Tn3 family transposase [Opitutaceae bacterium]|nr:Tn3 family transposase [Opitutaceae bacterium]
MDRFSLRATRRSINPSLLPHLSPVGWEHINLTGDYIWPQTRRIAPRKFRPLCPTSQA